MDLFILLDDAQFTPRDWRNRNKIKTPQGLQWITVPVLGAHARQAIDETSLDRSADLEKLILRPIELAYRRARYFSQFFPGLQGVLLDSEHQTITDLNVAALRWLMHCFGVDTPIKRSREFSPEGTKTDRLIDLLKKSGATDYVSGPSAADYLDPEAFRSAGIQLWYKSYSYPPYTQLWGAFEGGVSSIDLLFNEGEKAKEMIQSQEPDQRVL